MMDSDTLRALAREASEAQARLQAGVIAAVKAGMPRLEAHKATGVARTTINRWLEEDERP